MTTAYLPYIVTEAYCIIFTATILLRLNGRFGSEREIAELKKMLYSYIVMLIADILSVLFEGQNPAAGRFLPAAVNAVAMLTVAMGCYYWFRFVEIRLDPGFLNDRKRSIWITVPVAVVVAADIVSVFNGCVFTLDAHNRSTDGPLSWYQFAIDYAYLIIPTVQSLFLASRAKDKSRRTEYWIYAAYMVGPLAAGFLEERFPTIPILELNIFMVIQLLFITIYLDRVQELAEKDRELTKSRTAIMLSQIQPHFLYNTLSVIQDMCHDKAPEAEKATIEFAEFLRGNLDSLSQREPVMFERELRHTKNYLSLECTRFGGLLHVVYDIRAEQFRLPALSLQPLVENAVRYGVMQRENGGTVRISTWEEDSRYVVTVTDDGVGFDVMVPKADGRTHIGITNVKNRLETMCRGSLTITSIRDQGTKAVITIPKAGKEDGKTDEGTDGRQ